MLQTLDVLDCIYKIINLSSFLKLLDQYTSYWTLSIVTL